VSALNSSGESGKVQNSADYKVYVQYAPSPIDNPKSIAKECPEHGSVNAELVWSVSAE
jgi:hypothetical protein